MTRHDWLRPTFTRHSEIYLSITYPNVFSAHFGLLVLIFSVIGRSLDLKCKTVYFSISGLVLTAAQGLSRLFFHRKRLLSPPPSDNGLITHNLYTAYTLNLLTLHDLFRLLKRELLIFLQYLTGSVTGIMYAIQARCHPIYTWLFSRLFKIRVQLL